MATVHFPSGHFPSDISQVKRHFAWEMSTWEMYRCPLNSLHIKIVRELITKMNKGQVLIFYH
jgi:hypothetical protein